MMQIVANGETFEVEAGTSLVDFLASRRLVPARVVVEYNGLPLTQAEAREVTLVGGDRLEIVRMVAGG